MLPSTPSTYYIHHIYHAHFLFHFRGSRPASLISGRSLGNISSLDHQHAIHIHMGCSIYYGRALYTFHVHNMLSQCCQGILDVYHNGCTCTYFSGWVIPQWKPFLLTRCVYHYNCVMVLWCWRYLGSTKPLIFCVLATNNIIYCLMIVNKWIVGPEYTQHIIVGSTGLASATEITWQWPLLESTHTLPTLPQPNERGAQDRV